MPNFTVSAHGVDSSGRAILSTAHMWDWWEIVVAELGFRPTIVQGAFMSRVPGGGASDSAGYHDLGGCFDLRTWDLSADQQERVVRTLRNYGAAAWRRDQRHGMDPHLHFVLGTDKPLASGAASQWRDYIAGHNGLSGDGPDYEWRPNPLVLTPPEDDMKTEDFDRIQAMLDAQRASIVKDLLAAVVDGSKLTVRHVLDRLGKAFDRNGKPVK